MANRITSKIANNDLLTGDILYLQRARITLPYLVRLAKAGQNIYYSDLAQEINISNPRNLNYILGAIGNALLKLGERTNTEIPPIQCVVINKRDELPGEGIGWFISPNDFNNMTKSQKKRIVETQLTKIYTFQKWDWVLQALELKPLNVNFQNEIIEIKMKKGYGGGESESHKRFKEFISRNPTAVGLNSKLSDGIVEYILPSEDTIDVLFIDNNLKIGIEVKSNISDSNDIFRGIFQCVKYKHLIEAEQIINNELPNSRVILALQGELPSSFITAKNLLGIEIIDNIKIK